jgi:hypothetical protein
MDISLLPLFSQRYDIGRAAIMVAVTGSPGSEVATYWDGSTPIDFMHLGNTEGEIAPAANSEYQTLLLPESTGPAPIKKALTGHAPTFSFNFFASKEQLAMLSPTGSASAGNEGSRLVNEQTWWLVPENLLRKRNTDGTTSPVSISLSGGIWTKDGDPFTADDTELFGLSLFLWKLHPEQAMPVYRWENVGKGNVPCTVHVLQDFTKPDGHQLWTLGADLAASGIDLEGESSS